MKLDYAASNIIGPRETNDDRILINNTIINEHSLRGTVETPAVFAVCDGCGGYLGGNVAAQTVCSVLTLEDANDLLKEEGLASALERCADAVNLKKAQMPEFSEMCTTIAGCVFSDISTVIFHAGDSRVYRLNRWGLARMTLDHSAVQGMVNAGLITAEQADEQPNRNVITRCIGGECSPPEIYVSPAVLGENEKFMICSDGLWDYVDEKTITEALKVQATPDRVVDALIDAALKNGAEDNVSVCIIQRSGAEQTEVVTQEEKDYE